jgi:hypothetical protein
LPALTTDRQGVEIEHQLGQRAGRDRHVGVQLDAALPAARRLELHRAAVVSVTAWAGLEPPLSGASTRRTCE